jgi:hypothetical protein
MGQYRKQGRINMTRALQKHRGGITFADWFAELRELAGERWADVADQAPTAFAVWGGGATPAQALYNGGINSPAEGSGVTSRFRYRILNARLAAAISAMGGGCVKTQMRDRRMVGRLAIFDCRISTDVLRSMSF